MMGPAPIAGALDAPNLDTAAHWAGLVTPYVSTLKVGLELYLRYGQDAVASVRGASRADIFLDLKLNDIPETVRGAALAVAWLRPALRPGRARAGPAAIAAVAAALPETKVVAVTVLTSLSDADLERLGVAGPAVDAARRLAVLSVEAGARGLVCSPREVAAVREEVDPEITLITPGVRSPGQQSHDQARVATPCEALQAGADLLVVGRPITRAADPGAAAAAMAAEIRHCLQQAT